MAIDEQGRRPFPELNSIRQFVRNEFDRRRKEFPTETVMPFVQFTSGLVFGEGLSFFHIGLHSSPADISALEQSYGNEDVVGYAYSGNRRVRVSTNSLGIGTGASGRHPVPGVTSARIEHMGVNEPIKVTVYWKCYNTTQLEFLRQMFGLAGNYAVLEIGQTYSDSRSRPVQIDYSAESLAKCVFNGRKHIIDNYVSPSNGNYDLYIGQVTNYEMSITPDGSYECLTEFYSVGEAVFGLSNHKELRYRSNDKRDSEGNLVEAYTINDYFDSKTRKFENLISRALKNGQAINLGINSEQFNRNINQSIPSNQASTDEAEQAKRRFFTRFNEGVEARYVSFHFFLTAVINDIFKNVKVEGEDARREILLFKNINYGFNNDLSNEPLVGDNEKLASTQIPVVIVKQEYINKAGSKFNKPTIPEDSNSVLFGSKHAVSSGLTNGGYLSRGVWLNVELIRDSFLTHNTFYGAIQGILTRMSNATVGFWNLSLVFDEEDGYFKIIDKNFVADSIPRIVSLPSYVFNRGSFGELLGLTFNSSFSKEMKTAVLLSSRIKSDTPPTTKNFSGPAGYRPVQGPEIYGPVLNWSKYPDRIDSAVSSLRSALGIDSLYTPSETWEERNRLSTAAGADEQLPDPDSVRGQLLYFDESLKYYIKTQTQLIDDVFQSGLANKGVPNAFLAPVPTEMTLELTTRGIGGVSFFDIFSVAKLPAIYNRYGVFAVNGIEHTIDEQRGWITQLRAFFYFCFPDGDSGQGLLDTEDTVTYEEVFNAVRRRSDPNEGIDAAQIVRESFTNQ